MQTIHKLSPYFLLTRTSRFVASLNILYFKILNWMLYFLLNQLSSLQIFNTAYSPIHLEHHRLTLQQWRFFWKGWQKAQVFNRSTQSKKKLQELQRPPLALFSHLERNSFSKKSCHWLSILRIEKHRRLSYSNPFTVEYLYYYIIYTQ